MNAAEMFPYFFPTTVLFVDDNAGFLRGLELKLPQALAYILYESPGKALERINTRPPLPPLYQRCFSHYQQLPRRGGDGQRLIHLDMSLIEREIANPVRFTEVSTVFVDYDMPSMDGLEFCERLTNPHIRKVMLTGVADEKVAVKAFNDGLIDHFINKSDPDAIDRIRVALLDMQRAYFRDISEVLRSSLTLESPGFLADPEFATFFDGLCSAQHFVEYYVVDDPPGLLLLRDTGELARLVVQDASQVERAAAEARAAGAPAAVVAQLAAGDMLGWFYEPIDTFLDAEPYHWEDYLHRAARTGRWHYALIENPPVDIDFEPRSACYRAYLERLDAEFVAARR